MTELQYQKVFDLLGEVISTCDIHNLEQLSKFLNSTTFPFNLNFHWSMEYVDKNGETYMSPRYLTFKFDLKGDEPIVTYNDSYYKQIIKNKDRLHIVKLTCYKPKLENGK